ncbi:hypothetical protein WN944_026316 [Citrus x changshan-huyou]|uniref:F-box domain-containing protein n=1 Tax=Citrus x changshan-huyou TaxID=2935761 RepID=A0AAP0LSA1_9ROSI
MKLRKKRNREERKEQLKEEETEELLQDPLEAFGGDIMLKILQNLKARSVAPTLFVSRAWNGVASSDTLWTPKFVGEILEICPSLQTQVNGKGDTPLHVAAKFGHFNIANVLMKRAKLAQHEDEELESGLGAARQMIRMTNEKKNTALQSARGSVSWQSGCVENTDEINT